MNRTSPDPHPSATASPAALYAQARQAVAQSRHWERTAETHQAQGDGSAAAAARAQAAQAREAAAALARAADPSGQCLTSVFMDVADDETAADAGHRDSGDDDADGLS